MPDQASGGTPGPCRSEPRSRDDRQRAGSSIEGCCSLSASFQPERIGNGARSAFKRYGPESPSTEQMRVLERVCGPPPTRARARASLVWVPGEGDPARAMKLAGVGGAPGVGVGWSTSDHEPAA